MMVRPFVNERRQQADCRSSVDRRRHATWQLEPVNDTHACRELAA
ncbi:hypothetical protein P3T25_001430 [Paraburkholderia sp. GAS32]